MMQRLQTDSVGRHRRAGLALLATLATLAAGVVSACAGGARQTRVLLPAALGPAPDDSLVVLIECARTEASRLGYQPVSDQASAAAEYFDVDHPEEAQWFVAERIGPAAGRVVVAAEARRDRAGRRELLATATQLDNSYRLVAQETNTRIRRSISWASTHGTEPAPTVLTPDVRADLDSLRSACNGSPSPDSRIQSPPGSSR